ncbi:hypothetical protein CQW23_19500 [Capsicum baccatum]|uniref:G-patch domain-containing protein n=1 Tax=Capsicum baccatum TaxID=33114 RepID=A0A2G2W5Z5_CAPBA|nr:hypothetical protein CQW23_19500 [Capsicum baccatum]
MQTAKINERIEPIEVKILSVVKMVALEVLTTGYQPKIGLGQNNDSIIKMVQLKHQRGTTGLGYNPTSGGVYSEGSEVTVFVPAQVPVSGKVGDENIIGEIENLFVVMIEGASEMDFKKLTIHDAEPREVLQNWTISPFYFDRSHGSVEF